MGEATEDLHGDAAAEAVGVGLDDPAQARVQVLARRALAEGEHEGLVLETGGAEGHVLLGHADGAGEEPVGVAAEWHTPTTFANGEPAYTPQGTIAIGFV